MAAVTYSAGTEILEIYSGGNTLKTWISPSSMDSADTVAVPTITGKSVAVISCYDLTTGDAVTATVSSYTVTIDASGGTTNKVYQLTYAYY
jgi:hypothetical protein